ncbi:tyrosine-type recombinase/integrase [Salidesulfovibrio brasiliensis]|uniref:tyrosine-type recombinase/integrase n=1 Tax=Salidesulfovibrio brasiliensis TaxID=221711 RepID=UPI0006D1E70D|nr:site-specific integrase [Salidesulfovibrio brasiliensis]
MTMGIMGLREPFKRGSVWYYEVNRKRMSLRTSKKSEAKLLFAEIKRQYLAGRLEELKEEESTVSLGEFEDEYLEWAESTQEPKTFKANRLALRKLLEVEKRSVFLEKLGFKSLDTLVAKCKGKKLKTTTINVYIRHVRAVFNKAVDWGYVNENPFKGYKELRTAKRPPAFLSAQECTNLIKSIEDMDLRRFVIALLYTGRRRGELFALEWADIDFERDCYLVRKSKTHLAKRYPMHPEFRAILESFDDRQGRVFKCFGHPDTLTGLVKQALVDAGHPDMRLHDLRHSFASNLAEAGESLQAIGELLGHTDKRTTEIYAHLSDHHLRASLNRLKLDN